jgi:hypothetical protein
MAIPSTSPAVISPEMPGTPARARDLTEALDILTHHAQSELGNVTQSLFFMGDGLQRAIVDGVFNLFLPQTWTPNNILRLSSEAVRQTIQLSQLLQPQQASLAWQELRNKLQVFILVKNLASVLRLPADKLVPLPELVEKAYSIDPFQALWAVEGLGHYYADIYWEKKGAPQGLLWKEQAPVADKSLLMLHAGIGLSFADRLLGNLTSEASGGQVRDAVQYFLTLCKNNSRKGYLGAAVESLGLVTRDFYPDLLQRVDQQLRQVGPEFLGFFWHGVGRALYFSREYFLPVLRTVWSGVDSEAGSAPERLSAMAGLSWAVTMVNLRQPAIVQNMVRAYIEHSDLAEGFTNGVISSLIMRADTTPDVPFVAAFYQHQPDPNDRELAVTWAHRISGPSRSALQTYYPVLRQHHALDQVFRYQDLAALVSHLQQNAGDGPRNLAYQN